MDIIFDKYSDEVLANMIIDWRDNFDKEDHFLYDIGVAFLILIIIELVHDLWELNKEQILSTIKVIHNKWNSLNSNTSQSHVDNSGWVELINYINNQK